MSKRDREKRDDGQGDAKRVKIDTVEEMLSKLKKRTDVPRSQIADDETSTLSPFEFGSFEIMNQESDARVSSLVEMSHTQREETDSQKTETVNSNRTTELDILHYASKNGHVDVAKVLLKNDVDTNAVDKSNKTALFYANEKGHTKIVNMLMNQHRFQFQHRLLK